MPWIRSSLVLVALVAALTAPVSAQAGDHTGEDQPPLPDDLEVPPAPALDWEAELATFQLPPGFRIELVAAEPLVEDPVSAEFDEEGRLWVVEMRGYMPDVDGNGEDAPVGTIVVLRDVDGDGRMDERTVFLDELVLPRSVYPTRGGALVIVPDQVLFCMDTDEDGRADEITVVDTYSGGVVSPEHALNGFVRTLDNWYRCANGRVKYRFDEPTGTWTRGTTSGGGQWGITRDDLGRVFYNTNSDPFRGDLFPSAYATRNPNHGTIAGMNVRFARDKTTWPSRITPGVNRGYQEATLRDDFTLRTVTAVCGPHVFRGSALGEELRGDAFVPEPSGNLVKRYTLREKAGLGLEALQAYEGREFLTSTDERFRPVNAFGGPDGALYLVDFYRGILQHRMFVTSFLRKQILERGLQEPVGLGRIWRVVREDQARERAVLGAGGMNEWGWTQLVGALSHPDGWMRDTAQRVIVDTWEEDSYALELLEILALEGESAFGRMHALWTLEGTDELDQGLVLEALGDPDPRVQHAAVRVAEPFLSTGRLEIVSQVYILALRTEDARLKHQCLLSLGAVRTEAGESAIADLLTVDCSTGEQRSAALSGLQSHELVFLERLLSSGDWIQPAAGREVLLRLLARCVVRGGRSEELERLVTLAATRGTAQTWQTRALCEGLLAGRIKGPRGKLRPLRLDREPEVLERLANLVSEELGDLPTKTLDGLVWPGKPGVAPEEEVLPLSAEAQDWFRRGRITYTAVCTACHQPSGLGEPGKAPSLRGSEWVLGSEERLVRILAHGLSGPLRIDGQTWDMEMPALPGDVDELSGVLTYVRREWGHGADPISPKTVRSILERASGRSRPWTVAELLEVPE